MPRYHYGAMDPDPAPWKQHPLLVVFDHLPVGGINWLISQFLKNSGRSKRRDVLDTTVAGDGDSLLDPTQLRVLDWPN